MIILDRRRVELCLPSVFFFLATSDLLRGGKPQGLIDHDTKENLRICTLEPLQGLSPNIGKPFIKQVNKIKDVIMEPLREQQIRVVYMALLFWLQELLEDDVLVLYKDSRADIAISKIIETMEMNEELWNESEEAARTLATQLQHQCHVLGLYTGIDPK